jgi:hypothetical protein
MNPKRPSRVPHDAAAMNSPLTRHFRAIQALLATAAADEIRTRYKVGAIVRRVQDSEATYGARAVERLALALGRDQATLYRYGTLAKTWSEREMVALSRRRNCYGEPLSWSHWLELAAEEDWKPWLERALSEGWSVRRLKDEIETGAREIPRSESFDEDETTRAALLETIRDAERWNARVTHSLAPVLDRLARSPRRSPQIEELFLRSLDVFNHAHCRTGAMVARMRELTPAPAAQPPQRLAPRVEAAVPSRSHNLAQSLSLAGTLSRDSTSTGLRT